MIIMPKGVYPRTKIMCENISKAKMGVAPWNKGKKGVYTTDTKKKNKFGSNWANPFRRN